MIWLPKHGRNTYAATDRVRPAHFYHPGASAAMESCSISLTFSAMIGTDPTIPDSTETGANQAESNGTYDHDPKDWAHPGSQWE